jgi:hypothetical protein
MVGEAVRRTEALKNTGRFSGIALIQSLLRGHPMWSQRAEEIISQLIASRTQAQLEGTHTTRLNALHIGGSMWADCYLRPNGEVVIVGNDFDHPDEDTIYTDRSNVMRMVVWGAQRYSELKELIPSRPPNAVDCPCRKIPIFADDKVLCPECGALGWLLPEAPNDRSGVAGLQ